MKILVISNLYPPHYLGGYELECQQVCRELQERRHNVFVLTSDHRISGVRDEAEEVPVCRDLKLYLPFGQAPRYMRWRRWVVGKQNYAITRDQIQRYRPDLIFIWSQLRLTLGSLRAAADSGIPVVYRMGDGHITGFLPPQWEFSLKGMAKYFVDRGLFSFNTLQGITVDHVSCISHSLRNELENAGIQLQDVDITYRGVPLSHFPCKEQLGSLGTPMKVLYVGQVHPYKGVHLAIQACHRLVRRWGNPVQLSIVGAGDEDYARSLKKLAQEGPASIFFVGRLEFEELAKVYQTHDAFVFPSLWDEPQGVTYLEAMASGVPVVASKVGGQQEILKEGLSALFYPPESEEGLAHCLMSLATQKDLRLRLAEEGRRLVEREMSFFSYINQLERILQDIEKRERKAFSLLSE